jgi:hypothetical protein
VIWLNALATLAYLASSGYILRRHVKYAVLFGSLTSMQAWALISCFYNDLGIYNLELFRYTSTSLATTRLALFYLLFNLGFLLAAGALDRWTLKRRDYSLKDTNLKLGNFKVAVYTAVMGLVVYLGYNLYSDGIPILTGLDRLTFYQQTGPLERFVLAYGPLVAFLLGLFRRNTKRVSVNGVILLILLIYAFLVGHKFSFQLGVVTAYYVPIFVRYLAERPRFTLFRWKYAVICLVTIGVFIGVAYVTYYSLLGTTEGAGSLLADRVLAGQGEIWWAHDNLLSQRGEYDHHQWQTELDFLISPETGSPDKVGMRYLMVDILGASQAFVLFDRGYLYTMAYPAILTAIMPYAVALAIQFLAGLMFLVMLYYLHFCVVYEHRFRALVVITMTLPFVTLLYTGNLFVFLTFGMIVKGLVILALETGLFVNIGKA